MPFFRAFFRAFFRSFSCFFFVPWAAPKTSNHNILHFGPCVFWCFFWWSLLVKIGYTQTMSCLWIFIQIKPRIDWVKGEIGSWTGREFLSWSKQKTWKERKGMNIEMWLYCRISSNIWNYRYMSINLTTCLIESIRLSGWNYHILSYDLHFISFQEGPFHDRSFPQFFLGWRHAEHRTWYVGRFTRWEEVRSWFCKRK